MIYGPTVTEANHVTTRLANDARDGVEQLEKAANFITNNFPAIVEQLLRLEGEHGSLEAAEYVRKFENALTRVSAAAINVNHQEVKT